MRCWRKIFDNLEAELQKAQGDLKDAEKAKEDAEETARQARQDAADAEAERDRARQQAEQARRDAADADQDAEDAEAAAQQTQQQNTQLQNQLSKAEQAAIGARAVTLLGAMKMETDGPTPDITRPSSGLSVQVVQPSGYRRPAGAAPPSISGWQGVQLSRRNAPPAKTETAYVYTNIQALLSVPFHTVPWHV